MLISMVFGIQTGRSKKEKYKTSRLMKNLDFSQIIFELFTKVISIISDQITGALKSPTLDTIRGILREDWSCSPSSLFSLNRSSLSSHLHQLSPMIIFRLGVIAPTAQLPFMEERFGDCVRLHQFRSPQRYR